MTTYTPEQLTAMAKSCIWHKQNSPEVYLGFLLTMSMATGQDPRVVEAQIIRMAGEGK